MEDMNDLRFAVTTGVRKIPGESNSLCIKVWQRRLGDYFEEENWSSDTPYVYYELLASESFSNVWLTLILA